MMKRPFLPYLAIVLWAWFNPLSAQQQDPKGIFPPRGAIPRYLEDFSKLDTIERENAYLKVKYLPVAKKYFFSFGGEIKYRYEYFKNYRLGASEQDPNGFLLHRYLLHADFHYKYWFRVFTQFHYTDVSWRTPGPRAMDRNRLSVHQLFLELSHKINHTTIQLQAGRREYSYGMSRWMGFREGPNTRLSFDGVNLKVKSDFELNLFLIAPVDINPSFFDNETSWNKKRIGIHATFDQWIWHHNFDIYGFYFESPDDLPLMGNTTRKTTFGIRDKMVWPRVEVDIEGMLQLGWSDDTITSASMMGIDLRFQPFQEYEKLKLGLEFLYTSGKRNSRSMTFQSLHPSHFNTKNIDLFGKYNSTYLQPFLVFSLSKKDFINFETGFYLKSSKMDNVYNIPGSLLYNHDEYKESFLGTQVNLIYTRFWNPFFQTQIGYCRFNPSGDLVEATNAENTDFFLLSLTCRF